MITILDHGYVTHVESWGSDERIIEAARMSTNKGFQGWDKDEKLLRYLYENKHATPFEMAGMVIEVQAPIFVFREWHRHRTQSFNEMSARYTQMPNLHYVPSLERLMAGGQNASNKQVGDQPLDEKIAKRLQKSLKDSQEALYDQYELYIKAGLSKELARLNTPVSRYSRMRASASLRNWLAFLTLRQAPNAQWEIQQFAHAVGDLIRLSFPRTHALFCETAK